MADPPLCGPRRQVLLRRSGRRRWIQVQDRAIGFDAPGATYPHQDGAGRCSFEALVDDEETLERSRFLYDALYASIRDRLGT